MNIRQRFRFNSWLTICVLLGLIGLFYSYERNLNKIQSNEESVETMLREFIDVSITTEGYIHHDNAPHTKSWLEQTTHIRNSIPESTPLYSEIKEELANLEVLVLECQIAPTEYPEICQEKTQEQLLLISDLFHENYVITKEQSQEVLRKYKNLIIGYITLSTIVMILLSRENIKHVLHPLGELIEGVKEIQLGHYDYRLPIDQHSSSLSSKDELGRLAIAFNLMVAELQHTFANLQQELTHNQEIMEQLLESERNLRRTEEIAHVGSWRLDAGTDIMQCSEETFRIWGLAPSRKFISLEEGMSYVHPEDKEAHAELIQRIIAEKIALPMQFRIVRPDGTIRYIYQTTAIDLDEDDNILRAYGAMLDVTEERKIMDSLQEREQLLQQVMDTNPNMIYLFDEDGRIVMANQRLAERYGISLDELVGKNDIDLANMGYLDMESAQHFIHDDLEVIQTQQTKFIAEEKSVDNNGNPLWFQTTLTPLNRPDKAPMGLGVSVDISERKKIEEEIRDINANLENLVDQRTVELQNANEELRSFAYSISHDLRSPLRAIDGFSRILLEEKPEELTPQAIRYINLLRENAVMMGKLIEGLLEFSRKGRQALKLQSIDPTTLINNVLLDMTYEYPDHKPEIHLGELPECIADSILLKQVYQNLISNAFKFTEKTEKPVIEIGCKIEDNETIYFVKDNGVGFDMKYADRLFGVFQRLHRMDEFKGTGVGLAIVQRIIHRHGGTVWAEATIDEGAAFFFTIPFDPLSEETTI